MHRGLASRDLHHIGLAFVADHRIQHELDLLQRTELLPLRPTLGITDGASQVAVIADLDQRQTGVLFVVGAQTAVVRTAPLHRSVVLQRHLGRLDEDFAAAPVIIHVIGDQNTLAAMLHAMLEHEDFVVLKNYLAFALHETARADGDSYIVKKIRTNPLSHNSP